MLQPFVRHLQRFVKTGCWAVSGGSAFLRTNASKMAESIAHKVHFQFLTIKDIARTSPAHRPLIAHCEILHRPLLLIGRRGRWRLLSPFWVLEMRAMQYFSVGDERAMCGRCAGDERAMSFIVRNCKCTLCAMLSAILLAFVRRKVNPQDTGGGN